MVPAGHTLRPRQAGEAETFTGFCRRAVLHEQFCSALRTAQRDREQRQELTSTSEFGWVVFERNVLLDHVNRARAESGLPPVDAQAIARAEQSAIGHVDYTTKLALYCVDVAIGEAVPERRS